MFPRLLPLLLVLFVGTIYDDARHYIATMRVVEPDVFQASAAQLALLQQATNAVPANP